jgi:hypothetical protein
VRLRQAGPRRVAIDPFGHVLMQQGEADVALPQTPGFQVPHADHVLDNPDLAREL